MVAALRLAICALALAGAVSAGGCGDDDSDDRVTPAPPPPGWRTVANEDAGFAISAPRRWKAKSEGRDTRIDSPRSQLVATVSRDTSRTARELPPDLYARRIIEGLPDFEGSLAGESTRVRSPYRNGRVDGIGRFRGSRRPQRITVAGFKPGGDDMYVVIAFRNAVRSRPSDERSLERMLSTLRAARSD